MLIVLVCFALMLGGLFAIVAWGGLDFQPPPAEDSPPRGRQGAAYRVRRYFWYAAVTSGVGLAAGFLSSGPGGRLIMRLLAVTSGPEAQGKITEAREVVGQISLEGTLALFVFGGLFTGLAAAALYILIRKWLPSGRTGGLIFGLGILLVFGSRIEPLRADNVDFSLVGPGLLSVASFSLLALFHGMVIAALSARLSRAVPLFRPSPRVVAAYLPILPIALPPGGVILVFGAALAALSGLVPSAAEALSSRHAAIAARVILAAGVLVALPGFVSSVMAILKL